MKKLLSDLSVEEKFRLEQLFRQSGITSEMKTMIEVIDSKQPISIIDLDCFTEEEGQSLGLQLASKFAVLGDMMDNVEDKLLFECLQKLSLYGKGLGVSLAGGAFNSLNDFWKENNAEYREFYSTGTEYLDEKIESLPLNEKAQVEVLRKPLVFPD